jgi:hypothetical protein
MLPSVLVHGELRQVSISITNVGSLPIQDVTVLPSIPGFLTLDEGEASPTFPCELP